MAITLRQGSKVVVENGRIIKIGKDKKGIITTRILTQNWYDRIDYGAITLTIGTKNKSSKLRMKTENSKKSEEEIICIKTNRRVSEHEKI